MASVTVDHLLQAAAERPVLAVWLAGAVVMLTILSAAALARPRTFAVVLDDAALGDRTDRWLLVGALIVVGRSAGRSRSRWPPLVWGGGGDCGRAASVRHAVLAGTAAAFGTPETWRMRAATVREQGMAAIAATVVDRWLPAEFAAAHPELRQELLDAVLATPVDGYAACCGALETMDLSADLAKVTAPTLVITGSEDQSTPPELGRAVAAGIRGARLVEIAGAAHLPNVSHAEEFTRLVADFLLAG